MDTKYCSDEGKVICDREAVGTWEKFKAFRHRSWPKNTVALYSGRTGNADATSDAWCSDEGILHLATHPLPPQPQP